MNFITISLIALTTTLTLTDVKDNEKHLYRKASNEFDKGNYQEAIVDFQKLTELDSNNSEYHFLTGLSYYKMHQDLDKAIYYFNNSINHFEKDTIAEAYYYLGRSYREKGEFDKAKQAFKTFEHFLKDNDMGNALRTEIETEYQWVDNAIAYREKLKNGLRVEDMSSSLNSVYGDYAPVYIEELDLLAFTSRRPGISNELAFDHKYYEDMYFCKRRDSNWVLLTEEEKNFIFNKKAIENTEGHDAYVAYESKQDMFVYKNNKIYQTRFENGEWSELEEFEIANKGAKHTPSVAFSPDGNTLYFVHTEAKGKGGKDIYVSHKDEKGNWSKPENMDINTPLDEDGPFVSRDGNKLYFSSKGHNSMGGYDFFRLDLTDKNAKPVRMKEPYNSLADDIFIDISNDEKHGFISSNREGSMGDMDIFEIFFKPFNTTFEGLAVYKNDYSPAHAEIIIVDKETGKEIKRIKPDPNTGKYNVTLENNKTYVFKVNGNDDNEEFVLDFKVPEQDKDVHSIQVIELESHKNNKGQTDAKVLTVKSYFDNMDTQLALKTPPTFNKESEWYSELSKTNPIKVVDFADTKFERHFGYNQNEIEHDERFAQFLENLETILQTEGKVTVNIEASASKVPTRTFVTNKRLAKKRAEVPKDKIVAYFKSKGIDVSDKINFVINSAVQGPNYKNDFDTNRALYEEFQYVKVNVEKAK